MLRLTKERRKRGLSQAQLARLADIHPSSLSQLESGIAHPWPAWKARLGRALHVEADSLFDEVEDEPHT